MKGLFALVAAATVTAAAVAQDAPKPQLRGSGPAPAPAPAPSTEPATAPAGSEGIGLIPETFEPVPKPKGSALTEPLLDFEKPEKSEPPQKIDKTTAAEDEMNARIRFRELKTKLERDPKVREEADRAARAKTDYEKREALKAYYHALYDKLAKLDPSLAKRAFQARERFLHRMVETRISPTEPLDPARRNSVDY